jgi:cytoskeletal protein CcmA (bactofilin family)
MLFKSKSKARGGGVPPMTVEPSYIGRNSTIEGHIVCEGELHVDGSLRGRIRAQLCVIDRHGVLYGDISAAIVHVRGRVIGPIQGSAVYIYAGAHVEGDVYNDTLSIEPGAYVNGSIRHNPQLAEPQPAQTVLAANAAESESEVEPEKGRKLRVISSQD